MKKIEIVFVEQISLVGLIGWSELRKSGQHLVDWGQNQKDELKLLKRKRSRLRTTHLSSQKNSVDCFVDFDQSVESVGFAESVEFADFVDCSAVDSVEFADSAESVDSADSVDGSDNYFVDSVDCSDCYFVNFVESFAVDWNFPRLKN